MADTIAAGTRHSAPWAVGVIVGAAAYLAAVLALAFAPALSAATVVAAAAGVLLVAGPTAVARSGLAGPSLPARAGAVAAGAGWALVALGYAVAVMVGTDAVALYATGTGLIFFGMLVLGGVVLRAGHWRGAGRWTPLACALYLVPTAWTFGQNDAVSTLLLAGWMVPWLALGATLLRTRSA